MAEDSKNMELLTVEEAAAYLKFSTTYLYRLCREKKIPHINYGRHIRFRKIDLFEWLGAKVEYDPAADDEESAVSDCLEDGVMPDDVA